MPERLTYIPARLPERDWFIAFSTRVPADYKADTENGERNRQELAAQLAPLPLRWLALEHADRVVTDPSAPITPADAVILTRPGQAIAFTTADCLPIVILDSERRIIAGIHAGWRGLAAGVIENTLGYLGTGSTNVHVWIGPGIAQADYQIGPEAYAGLRAIPALQQLQQLSSKTIDELMTPDGENHWLADLSGIATLILTQAGLPSENIKIFPESTFANSELHSARRDGASSGRMATVVGLKAV